MYHRAKTHGPGAGFGFRFFLRYHNHREVSPAVGVHREFFWIEEIHTRPANRGSPKLGCPPTQRQAIPKLFLMKRIAEILDFLAYIYIREKITNDELQLLLLYDHDRQPRKLCSSREFPRCERNAIRSPMSVERVKEVEKPIKFLRGLRAGRFEDVTVLGSQYRDDTRAASWYVAVWSERDIRVRIYHLSGEELPDHVNWVDREALLEIIHLWEHLPASRPS
jgi:hypothetical protein